jgi:hypothetical protein
MFVSKHHYALELAKRGNTVFFVNPPEIKMKWKHPIIIENSDIHQDLFIVKHHLFFPYNIKFHIPTLFHSLMSFHIRQLIKSTNAEIDILWSFDLGNIYPFKFFPRHFLKIFHPVDEPLNQSALNSAHGADVIFTVTPEILKKYHEVHLPGLNINHGLSPEFNHKTPYQNESGLVHVGFSGNLLREDIDREIFLKIISQNKNVIFECWGSYNLRDANLSGSKDQATLSFIKKLESCENVLLHGAVNAITLSEGLNRMHAFLICYDVLRDQSKGTNYHKILEYLSTGKIVISNYVSNYEDKPNLVQMVEEKDTNASLPALFCKVVHSLDYYNSVELKKARRNYAFQFFYPLQLDKIEQFITNTFADPRWRRA